ncbi:MAG: hypothetical protein ACRDOH_29085 [Streptosporangiaceae bacterium]
MPSRNDSRNDTAACPACGQLFNPAGRRRWCSGACRQAGWRRRHPDPPAAAPLPAPPRPARDHTVYECPACQARYLGEQWCHDCTLPCRKIGYGGPCPHCDEPVAIDDLAAIPQ